MAPVKRPSFVAQRLNGTASWATVFWRDMLVHASLINLVLGFSALLLLSMDVNGWFALALHSAALPWNLILLVAVCRARGRPAACVPVAFAWFFLMLFV